MQSELAKRQVMSAHIRDHANRPLSLNSFSRKWSIHCAGLQLQKVSAFAGALRVCKQRVSWHQDALAPCLSLPGMSCAGWAQAAKGVLHSACQAWLSLDLPQNNANSGITNAADLNDSWLHQRLLRPTRLRENYTFDGACRRSLSPRRRRPTEKQFSYVGTELLLPG